MTGGGIGEATPLMLAAQADDPWLVEMLLELGVDVHARDDGGHTVMHWVNEPKGKSRVLEPLLRAGADVNVRDRVGATPLCEVWSDVGDGAYGPKGLLDCAEKLGLKEDVNAQTREGHGARGLA